MIFNKRMFFKLISIASFSFFITSCGGDSENKTKDELGVELPSNDAPVGDPSAISEEAMAEIIHSIPSPVEMSSLIKSVGNEYNPGMLNSTDNMSEYATGSHKALAIGIYGADLGYINIYEKTYSALNYLNVIKGLADDIKVGQFFDFNTLKRLAKTNKDVDSLLYITTSSFNDMDSYLREQKRNGLSVLMAAGAWLEGLYIACEVVKEKDSPELIERIGEQKPIVDSLLKILTVYKEDPFSAKVITGFENIQKQYSNVKIDFDYQQPEMKEVNGELVVEDKSSSTVTISGEEVKAISAAVHELRTQLIK